MNTQQKTLSEEIKPDPIPEAGIVRLRSTRFAGETQTCSLNELSTSSLEGLRWMYRWLEAVGEFSSKNFNQSAIPPELEDLFTRENLDRFMECARTLVAPGKRADRIACVLHDIRGVPQHIIALIDLWLLGKPRSGSLQAITILARDHAKVMRHSLIGLDEKRRQLDTRQRVHGVENLRRRFPYLVLCNRGGEVRVDFAAAWNGNFANSCPEFSTVLKQLYNLMNNAARHTVDQLVLVRVYAKPSEDPRCVRFVVGNSISLDDREKLSPEVMATLWCGYTTTSSGLGLVSSAAFVAEAFGLEGPERAVDLGYVGSRVTENGYIAWLHWPALNPCGRELG